MDDGLEVWNGRVFFFTTSDDEAKERVRNEDLSVSSSAGNSPGRWRIGGRVICWFFCRLPGFSL